MIKFCKKCQSDTERNAKGDCKPCAKAYKAALHLANPEKRKAYKASRYAANPEKFKAGAAAIARAYYAANSGKNRARAVAWRLANPIRSRAAAVSYRAANPEKKKAYNAAWRAANPEARRIYRQNRRARKLENGGNLSRGLSAKLFKLQKGKCPCCKQPLGDDFHLDHIEPIARGGSNTDNNIQLLRAGCNLSKSAKDPVQFMQQRGFLI